MAYLPIPRLAEVPTGDPASGLGPEALAFLRDLASRREFNMLRYIPPAPAAAAAGRLRGYGTEGAGAAPELLMRLVAPGFRPHGAQHFLAGYCTPDTEYPNVLAAWQTGTGKSPGGVLASLAFAESFRRAAAATGRAPLIAVLGFTIRATILKEMLTRPEFGFVSAAEADALRRLRELALLGGANSDESKRYGVLSGVLRRRITDQSRGGSYRFYGYKEFANRLFIVTARGTARGFRVQRLYRRAQHSDPAAKSDLGAAKSSDPAAKPDLGAAKSDFGARLAAEVAAGNIEVNHGLLEALRGGFILADELQDVYNKQEKNNYGVAIQYTLDVLAEEAPRLLGLSATELKGSATEVVDLLNLLVPRRALPGGVPLRRSDFFYPAGSLSGAADDEGADEAEAPTASERPEREIGEDDGADDGAEDAADDASAPVSRLLPGALDRIAALAVGRVSFLLDTDTTSYPRRRFVGEEIEGIPYLRFTPCPMSPLHERTLLAERVARHSAARGAKLAAPGAHALYDMVFPNPAEDASGGEAPGLAPPLGLYRAGETPAQLMDAPAPWRQAAGVVVRRGADAGLPASVYTIGGPFLAAERVGTYSTKYAEAVRLVLERVRTRPGKIFLQHPRVRMSGVLLIQELLRANGFIGEEDTPTSATLCARCGQEQRAHKEGGVSTAEGTGVGGPHEYAPARFVMAHSDVDRATMDRSIARYNSPANARGDRYLILVGSKIVRQALDFKAVRLEVLLSLVTDIAMAIQIFGRVARQDSHIDLSEAERDVEVMILVSVASDWKPGQAVTAASPELWRWMEKMREYLVIQEVRRAMHRGAIDGFANYDRMIASDPALEQRATLEALPYKPAVRAADVKAVTDATFNAYGHADREAHTAAVGLRALFAASPVWTYEGLRASLRAGAVQRLGGDPAMYGDGAIARALLLLMRRAQGGRAPPGAPTVVYAAPYFILARAGADGRAVLDYESYVRDQPPRAGGAYSYVGARAAPRPPASMLAAAWATPAGASMRLAGYLRGAQADRRFTARWPEYISRYLRGPRGEPPIAPLDHALVDEDEEFHHALLRRLVDSPAALGLADADLAAVRESYRRFRILLLASEVPASAAAYIRGALAPTDTSVPGRAGRGAVVGYLTAVAAQIRGADGWAAVPLEALGVGQRLQENTVSVGFLQTATSRAAGAGDRLKLRQPLAQIRARPTAGRIPDERTVPRGAVCETRPRAEQLAVLQRLRAAAGRGGLPASMYASGATDPCDEIKSLLLALESAARRAPRGMERGVRWLYLFHDRAPVPSARGSKADGAQKDQAEDQAEDLLADLPENPAPAVDFGE
jgi:hypothetical protein